MVTEFTSQPHTWRWVSIGIGSFRYICGTAWRSSALLPANILLLWILFWAKPFNNKWPPCSQCACSQVFAVLFYTRTVKFVQAQICVGDMCVSRQQATKGQQHHLSQNIGLAIARSARPAPPALSERNECVKETVPLKLFKVQSSNFKSHRKSGATHAAQLPTALSIASFVSHFPLLNQLSSSRDQPQQHPGHVLSPLDFTNEDSARFVVNYVGSTSHDFLKLV